jgi:hypothetical protein
MCNVKFFQPGLEILRLESDIEHDIGYVIFPARIRISQTHSAMCIIPGACTV